MFPKRPKDDLELPPLRNIHPLPPTDSFGFPRGQQLQPILPPPIATLAQSATLPPAYSVSLPRLPSMETNARPPAAPLISQSSVVQPRYYPQQPLPPSPFPSNIGYSSAPPVQQIGSTFTSTARPSRKEIKRRTKTGCLTCRKRRIKCDEQRPVCRNCQKSKRDCEGYDPIFRGAVQPTSIAPAMQNSSQSFHDFGSIDPTLNEAAGGRPLPGEYDPNSRGLLTAPPLSIEDVLNVGSGLSPPSITASSGLEGSDRETVTHLFEHLYAPAIDKFLETRWFTTRGLDHLFNNPILLEKFKVLKSRFIYTPSNNMHEFLITQSLEAHVIWETMILARQVSLSIVTTNDPAASTEIAEGVHDVARRIDVFEALVTNQKLNPANVLPEPPRSGTTTPAGKPALPPQLQSREQNFWYLTSKFCSMRDDSKRFDENPVEEIEKTLLEMRLLLDSRENRDIMYSIAVIRHFGHKVAEKAAAQGLVQSNLGTAVGSDEEDPAIKVSVARRFVQEEASGKGTNQVTQRVCGMVFMAWSKR